MINNIYIGNEYNIAKQPDKIYVKTNNYSGEVFSAYIADNMGLAKCIYTKAILPPEYQQVEYIQGTGTQYINTGVTMSVNNLAIEITAAVTSNVYSSLDGVLMGCYGGSSHRLYVFIKSSGDTNAGKIRLGIGAGYYTDSTKVDTNKHVWKVDMKNLTAYIDGVFKAKNSSSAYSRNTNNNCTIGILKATNADGNWTYENGKAKVYNAKIWSNGTLTHNYYPCYRKTDGEIGLYDIIAKEFKTRMGSGTFEKGNNINQEL